MNTLNVILAASTFAVITACGSTPPKQPVATYEKYNPQDAAWAHSQGNETVTGSAMVRLKNGDVMHCGALEVALIPVTPYTAERARILYEGQEKRVISHRGDAFSSGPDLPVLSENKAVDDAIKSACDADGDFEFHDIVPGTYYLHTTATQSRYVGSDNMFISSNVDEAVWWMKKIEVKENRRNHFVLN